MNGTVANDQIEASVSSPSIVKPILISKILTMIMRIVTQFPLICVDYFIIICQTLNGLCFKSSCYNHMIAITTFWPEDSISVIINIRPRHLYPYSEEVNDLQTPWLSEQILAVDTCCMERKPSYWGSATWWASHTPDNGHTSMGIPGSQEHLVIKQSVIKGKKCWRSCDQK